MWGENKRGEVKPRIVKPQKGEVIIVGDTSWRKIKSKR